MTLPTTADFNNAKRDLDDLEQIVNGDDATVVTTRIGGDKPTIDKFITEKMTIVQPTVDAALNKITNKSNTAVLEVQSVVDQAGVDAATAIRSMGWEYAGTFSVGFTLAAVNQYVSDGVGYFRWDGSFPKTVAPSATTETTGGVSMGAWVLVSIDSASRVGVEQGGSVQDYIDHNSQHALMPALSQFSKTRVVRILHCGTSIENSSISSTRVFMDALQKNLGKSGNQTVLAFGLGGSYTNPYFGWNKQRYSGLGLGRMVGNSGSQTIKLQRGFVKKIVLRYSTEQGGGVFDLHVDGVFHTAIDCSGSQSYSNEVVIEWPDLGFHFVELKPPVSGNAYVESIDFCVDDAGVHVIDTSYGGSSLHNYSVTPSASGSQVATIDVEGDIGLNALFNNVSENFKPDLIILPYTVNDAGTGLINVESVSIPSLSKIVSWAKNNGAHVLLICEMGGHYTLKTDSNYDAFNAMRAALIGQQFEPHVTFVDWHRSSGLADANDSMLSILFDRYYSATNIDVVAGTYTGDLIHPNSAGYAVLGDQLFRDAAISPTGMQGVGRSGIFLDDDVSVISVDNQISANAVDGVLFNEPIVNNLGLDVEYQQVGVSRGIFSNLKERLRVSDDEFNYATSFNDQILNSGMSDRFGTYKEFSSATGAYVKLPVETVAEKTRFTVTLIAAPGDILLRVNNANNSAPLSPSHLAVDYSGEGVLSGYSMKNDTLEPRVYHLTVEAAGEKSYVVIQGKFYGVFLTPTDFACIAKKTIEESSYVGIPVPYSALDYSSARKGKVFYEKIAGEYVEKECLKHPVVSFGLDGQRVGTLYKLLDRASCLREFLKLQGTISEGDFNNKLQSNTVTTTGNPRRYNSVTQFGAADELREFCIVGQYSDFRPTYRVSLYTGSTNTYLALQPDGSWVNNGGSHAAGAQALSYVDTRNGMPFSLSFALPSAALFSSQTNWTLIVQIETGQTQITENFILCEGRAPTV